VAASMIAIVPGYISRSVAGSYDNEGIAIFCMLLTYYLWVKSVKTGSIFWSTFCALAYFYMVSWQARVCVRMSFLHHVTGVVMGRVCVSDQPHPHARVGSNVDWTVLPSSVHCLFYCK